MHFSALDLRRVRCSSCVTVLVNAGARLLIWRVARGSRRGEHGPVNRRAVPPPARATSWSALMVLRGRRSRSLPLLFILRHLLVKGAGSLSLDFFTKMPVPAGETGGGVANAIVGTLIIVGTGLPDRHPDRHRRRASTAPSIPAAGSRWLTRFVADVLNGTPSIVVGVFAWTWIVARQKHFSGARRQRGARDAHDPDGDAHHRGDDQAGAALAARGGAGARLPALADQPVRSWCATALPGHRDRDACSRSPASPARRRRCSSPRSAASI